VAGDYYGGHGARVQDVIGFAQAAGTGVDVERHRCLIMIMVAISVATLAACGGRSTSSQPLLVDTSTSPPPAGEVRLGCGTACQSAGGYGGANPENKTWVDTTKVVGGAVHLDADGYVPVTVTCLVPATCQGYITLGVKGGPQSDLCGNYHHDGCSDMVINANSTQTFGVRLLPAALAYARAHSPVTVGVTAYASSPANCEDVPQLAPTYCAHNIFQFESTAVLQVTA
jgi:hypothetical protein